MERERFSFAAQRAMLQQRTSPWRKSVLRHEFRHAGALDALGMPIVNIDANPQGGGVEGVTKTGQSDLAKHAVAAAASIAAGESGQGGDRGIIRSIEILTGGAVTLGRSVAVARSINNTYDAETMEIATEIADVEYNGRLEGNGQFREVMSRADFVRRQIEWEKANGVLFESQDNKPSGEVKLAKYETLFNPFSEN